MHPSETQRALAAATSIASALDLIVDEAIVLHDSNRLAVRLLPCDVLARVAPTAHQAAQFEVDLAQRLAETESPVAALEPRVKPRVYERDGFVVTLWTYYQPVTPREVSPADYANALGRLHAGMRKLDVRAPHFTDRVEEAQRLVASTNLTPELAGADGSFSSTRYGSGDKRSATAALPSSYCTASRTQATCSTRRPGCCSSISRRVAAGPSSSTSPMCPRMSASATRALMGTAQRVPGPCSCHGRRVALGSGRPAPERATCGPQTRQRSPRGSTVADARQRDAPAGRSLAGDARISIHRTRAAELSSRTSTAAGSRIVSRRWPGRRPSRSRRGSAARAGRAPAGS